MVLVLLEHVAILCSSFSHLLSLIYLFLLDSSEGPVGSGVSSPGPLGGRN